MEHKFVDFVNKLNDIAKRLEKNRFLKNIDNNPSLYFGGLIIALILSNISKNLLCIFVALAIIINTIKKIAEINKSAKGLLEAYIFFTFYSLIPSVFVSLAIVSMNGEEYLFLIYVIIFGFIWLFLSLTSDLKTSLFVNEILLSIITFFFSIAAYIITICKGENQVFNAVLNIAEKSLIFLIPHMTLILLTFIMIKTYKFIIETNNEC